MDRGFIYWEGRGMNWDQKVGMLQMWLQIHKIENTELEEARGN